VCPPGLAGSGTHVAAAGGGGGDGGAVPLAVPHRSPPATIIMDANHCCISVMH
jgi:hypothetical protein